MKKNTLTENPDSFSSVALHGEREFSHHPSVRYEVESSENGTDLSITYHLHTPEGGEILYTFSSFRDPDTGEERISVVGTADREEMEIPVANMDCFRRAFAHFWDGFGSGNFKKELESLTNDA